MKQPLDVGTALWMFGLTAILIAIIYTFLAKQIYELKKKIDILLTKK